MEEKTKKSKTLRGHAAYEQAALNILALLAYPEQKHWRICGEAERFRKAIIQLGINQQIKLIGLARARKLYSNPNLKTGKTAKLLKTIKAGWGRYRRRIAVVEILRFANASGSIELSNGIIIKNQNSVYKEFNNWLDSGDLNVRGNKIKYRKTPPNKGEISEYNGTDSDDLKTRDFYKRALKESVPVLHIAYAMRNVDARYFPNQDPNIAMHPADFLLILVSNGHLWVERIINQANTIRKSAGEIINNTFTMNLTSPSAETYFSNESDCTLIDKNKPYKGIFGKYKPEDFIYLDIKTDPIVPQS